jgi:CBS domain-containing protein
MISSRTGCALVVDEGKLLGIFTERDFVGRVINAGLSLDTEVRQVMTPQPKTLTSDSTVQGAIEVLESSGFRHLPVVKNGGEVVGVLSVKDIINYLVEYFPAKIYNLPPTLEPKSHGREGA